MFCTPVGNPGPRYGTKLAVNVIYIGARKVPIIKIKKKYVFEELSVASMRLLMLTKKFFSIYVYSFYPNSEFSKEKETAGTEEKNV